MKFLGITTIVEFSKDDQYDDNPEDDKYTANLINKLTDHKSKQIYDFLADKENINDILCLQSNEEISIDNLIGSLRDVKYCRIFGINKITFYNTYIDEIQQVIMYLDLDTESG